MGYFDDQGSFYFLKKVEIRKVNMHYKLISDNRATFVRNQRNKSRQSDGYVPEQKSKVFTQAQATKPKQQQFIKPKVNHKK